MGVPLDLPEWSAPEHLDPCRAAEANLRLHGSNVDVVERKIGGEEREFIAASTRPTDVNDSRVTPSGRQHVKDSSMCAVRRGRLDLAGRTRCCSVRKRLGRRAGQRRSRAMADPYE